MKKININEKENKMKLSFFCAAEKGELAIAKELKKRDDKIKDTKDQNGNNGLHLACAFSGSIAMVKWLLDTCKIDIESKGYKQGTPFLCAAEEGQIEIAKLLKERGANIHAKDAFGYNALHLACLYSGSEAMVNWLLDECKIDIESKGYRQKTPYLCAVGEFQIPIAKLLEQRGADTNVKDQDGNNALSLADTESV